MKVGDLIRLKDGSIGLITKIARSPSSGSKYIVIHTGEAFHLSTKHLEGWEVVNESR
jgi:hypothetical protein